MEQHRENIDHIVLKIKVLDGRIQKLQEIADQVVNELKSEYNQQINALIKNNETAKEILDIIIKGDKNN